MFDRPDVDSGRSVEIVVRDSRKTALVGRRRERIVARVQGLTAGQQGMCEGCSTIFGQGRQQRVDTHEVIGLREI